MSKVNFSFSGAHVGSLLQAFGGLSLCLQCVCVCVWLPQCDGVCCCGYSRSSLDSHPTERFFCSGGGGALQRGGGQRNK